MEYYSAMRKKEILPIVTTWMKCEGIMLGEKSQMEKGEKHTLALTYGI